MRSALLTSLITGIAIATFACKESPAPTATQADPLAEKKQAAQSLGELMGSPEPAAKPTQPSQKLPPGHPPIGGNSATGLMSDFTKVHAPPMVAAPFANKGSAGGAGSKAQSQAPLKASGAGSSAELDRCLKSFEDDEDKKIFRNAFLNVFHSNRAMRNPGGAEQNLQKLLEKHPKSAEIYRVMGYAAVDNGFQMARAMRYYKKAIELAPDYGEVHYALAFMYAMGDRSKGAVHFKKALSLGIKDERGIGPRFYAGQAQ